MAARLLSVLLVEDDPDTREMLDLLMKEWGYRLSVATTATDGLKQLLQNRFDIIVLDNWLPDLDGIELCRQIREFDRQTPVVFFSAATMGSEDRAALQAGGNVYIYKGMPLGNLREAMERELRKAGKLVP
ncbi:MAG TPA: response regulator [Blastocatellia bacterium]|nr:response regulator [Blastocatellia bacterium]